MRPPREFRTSKRPTLLELDSLCLFVRVKQAELKIQGNSEVGGSCSHNNPVVQSALQNMQNEERDGENNSCCCSIRNELMNKLVLIK